MCLLTRCTWDCCARCPQKNLAWDLSDIHCAPLEMLSTADSKPATATATARYCPCMKLKSHRMPCRGCCIRTAKVATDSAALSVARCCSLAAFCCFCMLGCAAEYSIHVQVSSLDKERAAADANTACCRTMHSVPLQDTLVARHTVLMSKD